MFFFSFLFFSLLVATCHTGWPIVASESWYLHLLLCNSQSLCCPFEAEGFWADVSQPWYQVSFFSESQSGQHTETPPTPVSPFPTANSSYSCFQCVWASDRTNVFSNYNPLWWWRSEQWCPLHYGPIMQQRSLEALQKGAYDEELLGKHGGRRESGYLILVSLINKITGEHS